MENPQQVLTQPRWLSHAARIVSIIFHPLFVGVMMAGYIIFIHPDYFIGFSSKEKMMKLLMVINNNVFFPMLVVVLLKALGFSSSILLKTQKERIVPYLACITFFFWTYYVFKNQAETPRVLVYACRGMFISVSVALVLNSIYKISMHGIGIGGALGMMLFTLADGSLYSGLPLAVTVLVSGLVVTARRVDSDHQWFDIITGILLGMGAQLLALWF
jgi:hypothetical protein